MKEARAMIICSLHTNESPREIQEIADKRI